MILQEFITVNVNPKNREYFISKGYDVPACTYRNKNPNTLTIKVCDLPEKSQVKVECQCDVCGKKQLKTYRRANTLCKKCSNKSRTGDSHYSFIHGNHDYSVYKSQAKKRAHEFSLSVDDFEKIVSEPCHYCGDYFVGIDRKDNSKGYTLENSLPCCKHCNIAKRDMRYDVFLNHIRKIYNHILK